MNRSLMAAVVMLAIVPASAIAQERAGDAALGAVSGAVVLGPIGAVAGAVIGYTAGPSISRSWRLHGSRSVRSRRPREPARVTSVPPPTREASNANGQMRPSGNPPLQPAPVAPVRSSMPPVQGFD